MTHVCAHTCSVCIASPQCAFKGIRIPCVECNRYFRSETCFDNHKKKTFGSQQKTICERKGVCTHTGKTGAGSESIAGCNVNKWVLSHAAGPAKLPARQICVPDWNSASRTPNKHLLCAAYQFQSKSTSKLRFLFLCTYIFFVRLITLI